MRLYLVLKNKIVIKGSYYLKKISGIYQILNLVNGKRYIGQSINIKHRFGNHKSSLNIGNHKNKYLQSSWNKYGEASFIFEIIELIGTEELNTREIHWIEFYNSAKREYGYNGNGGGDSFKMSESTKKKISLAMKGKKNGSKNIGRRHSEETIEKLIKTKRENKYIYTEEDKLKMRIAAKGRKSNRATIDEGKVNQIVLLLNKKEMTSKSIAKLLGVTLSIVKQIKSGKTWSYISGYQKKEYNKQKN